MCDKEFTVCEGPMCSAVHHLFLVKKNGKIDLKHILDSEI